MQEQATVKKKRFHPAVFLLASSMFATGMAGLVLEYIQATIASYVLGNSIEQYSLVIGLMLFMMGVAASVQKTFSDDYLIEKFILIEICLAVVGGYSPLAVYWAYGSSDHFQLVQYAFIMSLGFLIGLEIPVVLRINATYAQTLAYNIEKVFFADYFGSLAGALLWVYVLLRHFPLTESSFLLAGVNFSIAVVTYLYFRHRQLVPLSRPVALLIPLAAIVLVWGGINNRDWNFKLEQHLYEDTIVTSRTTRYQHLVVTRNPLLDEYRLFINGNLQFSSRDEFIYHELLVHPALSMAAHRRVLILGGGDGLALREVLKYPDVEKVVLVDLDPEMVAMATRDPFLANLNAHAFADARVSLAPAEGISTGEPKGVFMETGRLRNGAPETDRVADIHVMHIDADRFLAASPEIFDVILVDLPDPSSIELAKLYSRSFYRKVRSRLCHTGLMAVQATSPALARESFLCIGRTLRAAGWHALPYHETVPSFGDWGWYLCWKSDLTRHYHERLMEHMQPSDETRYYTPDIFRRTLVFGRNELQSRHSGVNTLMAPVLLDLYLRECWQFD
jgi:spermidine synthase